MMNFTGDLVFYVAYFTTNEIFFYFIQPLNYAKYGVIYSVKTSHYN